tara:strand:+ start:35 stop:361 length:327 start_codon:yes stop_codon:yes gene_type:complete
MDRFGGGSSNLYGNPSISSFDPGRLPNNIKGGTSGNSKSKSISVENKNKDDDNILMNSSIKKVMQKNRELHKMITQLKLKNDKLTKENDKLTKENTKYKKIVEKYKSR